MLPIYGLAADPENARKHPERQIAKLVESIREFGFLNPIVIAGNQIVAGHARVEAAQQLGIELVPCILADYLTETQRQAFALADNRIALDAEWDEEILRETLRELDLGGFSLEKIGFNVDEIELFGDNADTEAQTTTTNDPAPRVMCPHCAEEFEVRT